jgi:propanol-preferring alcohol dehydrogenase
VVSTEDNDVQGETMTTMHAAVVRAFGADLTIEDVPLPTPGPGQALVKLVASGVCHTDLHAAEGDWPVKPRPPFIPGHEGVGEVVELGAGVTKLTVGQHVGNAWLFSACGDCQYCNTGWETLCEAQVNAGYGVDGSFGQYMLVDAKYAAILPEGADPVEVAPILCAGVTVYKGLKMTEAKPGQWVVISGIGGLGHIAVQYARAMGLRVAAVDIADDKLSLAKKYGAEVVVNALEADPSEAIVQQTGGAHGVLVTAVHPSAFGQAIHMTRRGGTIVFNGLPAGDFPASIFEIVLKGLTVRGSIVGTRQDMQEALDFYARGEIHARVATRELSEINSVFAEMKQGKIDGRVVIKYCPGGRRPPGRLRVATGAIPCTSCMVCHRAGWC